MAMIIALKMIAIPMRDKEKESIPKTECSLFCVYYISDIKKGGVYYDSQCKV